MNPAVYQQWKTRQQALQRQARRVAARLPPLGS